jgi:hypothetical protein
MDKELKRVKKRRKGNNRMVLEEEEEEGSLVINDIDEVEDEDVCYLEDVDEDNDESIDVKERGAHTLPVTIREPVVDGSIIQSLSIEQEEGGLSEEVDDNDDASDDNDSDDDDDDDDDDDNDEEEEEEVSHYKLHPESELVLLFLMSIPHLDEGWDIHELILVSYHFNCLCVWHHSLD